ncbi:MAG: hypothetical protein EOP38_25160 [Rubrivivax sp.]|nr:MAG: hypothetical protein EOP38_25160 [Rubrivivax sp.]
MPEPSSGAFAGALATAMLSPFVGEYAVILMAAAAGATWPLSAAKTATRMDGAKLFLRLIGTAAVLTSFFAWLLETYAGWPSAKVMGAVSFTIAAMGDKWRPVIAAVASALISLIGRAAARFGGGA